MVPIDEEQAVFEQLTLNDFKKWNPTALNTFNNSTIIMTNKSDKIRMSWVWCFYLCCFFWVNVAGCSGEFRVVFKNFQNLVNLIFNILKEKLHISCLVVSFFLKRCKTFRIAQCKQPRLVKPCLNFDLCFIFKTSGVALLWTTVSYKLPPSLSQ